MAARNLKSLLVGIVLLVSACTKSNDHSQTIQSRVSRGGPYTQLPAQVNPATNTIHKVETSYVVADPAISNSFQSVIQQLVAPQIDPQFVGQVDGNTGVIMEAFVALNKSTGQVIPSQSRVVIQIADEYTGARDSATGETIPPITMIIQGSAGTYSGGQLQMTYQDCAGKIQILGGVVGSNFVGQVHFTNFKKADCSTALPNANQSYLLGTFQVPVCGFMTCNAP